MRRVSWFSCGAASAVATKLSNPDVIAYCDTGSEDEDNIRFMYDCEKWFKHAILILRSEEFSSTWDVWEKRKYISGIAGAPCTGALKIEPRLKFQKPDDVHIFGYTADSNDVRRFEALKEHWPELNVEAPLIERGLNKAACLAMIQAAGIQPPRVYAMGFPNANCIPCCKATSPAYWSLIRKEFPGKFEKMVEISRRLNVRLAVLDGERVFIDDIPKDYKTTKPIVAACDFLCQLAEEDL